MTRPHSGRLLLVGAGLLVLSGCATIRRHEAADTEQLLAAAGFQMRPASSAPLVDQLATMPRLNLVSRVKDGKVVYTYADPDNCHCLYVGGPTEYSAYQRLRAEEAVAAEMSEAPIDWIGWGPWWW